MTVLSRVIARTTELVLPAATVTRLRSGREWAAWADSLGADALLDLGGAAPDRQRALFKRYVRLVEIETHARCNRICSFCPNVIVDRRRNRTRTDAALLHRLFDQLAEIGYDRQVKVARYSEPLADLDWLLECLAAARARLPRAELAIVTNTDYLTPDRLPVLAEAGLNTVYMSIYLKEREQWSLPLAHEYVTRLAERLALRVTSRTESTVSLHATFAGGPLTLRAACMDFRRYGTDRGGTLGRYAERDRLGPCREPFETFVVDYNGQVVPCCNIRSDLPEHDGLAVGDVSAPSADIYEIYAGRLSAWRRSMVQIGTKASPCTTCHHREPPAAVEPAIARRVRGRLAALGRRDLLGTDAG